MSSKIYQSVQVGTNSKKETSAVQGDLFSDIHNHGDLFSDIQALSPEQVELVGLRAKNKILQEQNKKQAVFIAVAEVEVPKMCSQLEDVLRTNKKLCSRMRSAQTLVRILSGSNRALKGWCTKYRQQASADVEAEDYARHLDEQERARKTIPFPEGAAVTSLFDMAASDGNCNADKLERAIVQQKKELTGKAQGKLL